MKTSIRFVNHASVIVSGNGVSVLSDPWYMGDVFHKGWNLLHENCHKEIENLLDNISHIWISHEHPDHFSVSFFTTFLDKIRNNSIKILFQQTKDKRVYNFLTNLGIEIMELKFNEKVFLSNDYMVTCMKDGFYDSSLFIESYGEKILNLNDCDIVTQRKANAIFSITGEIDVLLTQFSFAAWKGGKNNKKWRDEAALEKIKSIELQIEKFRPRFLIPFASFAYFSNEKNYYLNDAANRPHRVQRRLSKCDTKVLIMKPNDILGGDSELLDQDRAVEFWNQKYDDINLRQLNSYETIPLEEIKENFEKYCRRIRENNNILLIRMLRSICPISIFNPVIIKITDLNCTVKFDYVTGNFSEENHTAMVSMASESLNFLFKNPFGFDTLTVNGCFEEEKKGGFINATKSLAIENLNNLGISVTIRTLADFSIIMLFLGRLYRVARKLE